MPRQPPTSQQPELDFESHLPAGQQWFAVWQLAGYWGLSTQHVIDLVNEGRFTHPEAGPVNFGGDPKTRATTRVPRACVLAFLNARKI